MAQFSLSARLVPIVASAGFLVAVVVGLMQFDRSATEQKGASGPLRADGCVGVSNDLVLLDFLYPGRSKPDPLRLPFELRGNGVVYVQACRTGQMSFHLSSREANGWAARVKVQMNGRSSQEFDVQGNLSKNISVVKNDVVTLAFVNYAKRETRRFISVKPEASEVWCQERPAYAEGGAWMNPQGTFGDITGGGRLFFRTCSAGETMLELRGVSDDAELPEVIVQRADQILYRGSLKGKKRLKLNLDGKSLIMVSVLNHLHQVEYERRLQINSITFALN